MESRELERLSRELSLRKRLQDALFLFSRSVSARLGLEPALDSLVTEVTALFGVRRISIWMHERAERTLTLAASSDPRERTTAARIRTDDDSLIAHGLRIDIPEISGSGDAQYLVVSLRAWRRALGTLVIEGEPKEVDRALLVDLSGDLARQLAVAVERVLVLDERIRDAEGQGKLRHRLVQAEKLASLGQFVAGIAHEMNNPLQGVLGHLELMIQATPSGPTRTDLQRIYNDADRAAKIVLNLLMFSGSQRSARRPIDVHDLVERTIALREAAVRRGDVRLAHRPGRNLPQVMGDPGLLQQALLNVIINAEQAITSTSGAGQVTATTRATRGVVTIEIRDNGPGIEADVLPRIFEPFFTTKDVGQGTGLGLAITYGIVQEHGGSITASSSARGAAFTIELPAANDRVNATGPSA